MNRREFIISSSVVALFGLVGTGVRSQLVNVYNRARPYGEITLRSTVYAPGAIVFFQLSNPLIDDTSTLVLNQLTTFGQERFMIMTAEVNNGLATIAVRNMETYSVESKLRVRFAIIQGLAT